MDGPHPIKDSRFLDDDDASPASLGSSSRLHDSDYDPDLSWKVFTGGIHDGVKERVSELIQHPSEAIAKIAAPIALGYALPFLPRNPATVMVVGCASIGLAALSTFDLGRRAIMTLSAMDAVNQDNSLYATERKFVAEEAGHAVFDYGLAIAGGSLGLGLGVAKRPLELSRETLASRLTKAGARAEQLVKEGQLAAPVLQFDRGVLRTGILTDSPELPVYEQAKQAVVRVNVGRGLGTGFFVNDSGLVVTNNHVISDACKFEVRTALGEVFKAKLVGREKAADLALLQVINKPEGKTFPFLPLADKTVAPGQRVMGIGHPGAVLPEVLSLGTTEGVYPIYKPFSPGPVTKAAFENWEEPQLDLFHRSKAVAEDEPRGTARWTLRVDAPSLPGASGRPLLNMEGQVVGVGHSGTVGGTPMHKNIGTTVEHLKAFMEAVDDAPPGDGWVSVRTSDTGTLKSDLDVDTVWSRRIDRVQLAKKIHQTYTLNRSHPRLNLWESAFAAPLLPATSFGIGEWIPRIHENHPEPQYHSSHFEPDDD